MRTLGMCCKKEEREGEHDGHGEKKRDSVQGRKITQPWDALQQRGDREITHP
jgi:hypothetical protein